MKKSKTISLVLITAALASCHKEKPKEDWSGPKVYMRSDTTATYTRTHHAGIGTALLWYYAFRPYRGYYGGRYGRTGYYSSGISEHSNIGHNAAKASVVRGGFGRGSSVSS
jgi:uncharacterized protein YgiB involved in biofilm formation